MNGGIKNSNSLILSFFNFLKHPRQEILKGNDKRKIWTIFRLWSFILFILIITEIPISILVNFSEYNQAQNLIFDLLADYPLYLIIFLFYIWAPVSEELAFRMALKYSPYRLSFSFSILFLIIIDFLLSALDNRYPQISAWLFGMGNFYLITIYILFILFIGFGLGVLLKKRTSFAKIQKWYEKNFFYIFYASSLLFGMAHIFNYYNFKSQFYILPLLIWPQFIIGLALGYIRMLFGLRWSMYMHFFHNFVFSAPLLVITFLTNSSVADLNLENYNSQEVMLSNFDNFALVSVFVFVAIICVLIIISWFSLIGEFLRNQKQVKSND